MLLAAGRQPASLPGIRERWKFISATIAKATVLKAVPAIGSMGCPYTCNFCIDSVVPYQPLSFEQISDDLRFLLTRMRRPRVAWHDPNFGVRFEDYMDAIERAVPPGRIRFVAESSLSLLSEPRLARLRRNGFDALLPGIESWFAHGNKSRTGAMTGLDKVRRVADHINTILRHIPFVQTNFVLGLDCDQGDEPFELTKRFLDLAPGAYPAFSLLTAYGRAAPLNLELQRAGRVLPFPFQFLDGKHAMNVRPKHYSWPQFYDLAADLTRYAHSRRMALRSCVANRGLAARALNLVRVASSNRTDYQTRIRALLGKDPEMRRFFDGETTEIPSFYVTKVRKSLGALWDWLPEKVLTHDPAAYLKDPTLLQTAPPHPAKHGAPAPAT